LLSGYSNAIQPYTAQNSINAANARQSQILADEAYWRNKEIEQKNKAGMWSAVGTGLGYLFS
jgi:hypothetical protein